MEKGEMPFSIFRQALERAAYMHPGGFPGGSDDKASACKAEDPLEEGKATHSSTLAWRIPWTEVY